MPQDQSRSVLTSGRSYSSEDVLGGQELDSTVRTKWDFDCRLARQYLNSRHVDK